MSGEAAGVPASVLVIGGGVAAYTFVEQLRLRGYRGELGMVSRTGLPHDLPPVSKEYLRGNMSRAELDFRDADFYAERGIRIFAGTASALRLPGEDGDPVDGRCRVEVVGADGTSTVAAELVVLATGARPVSATAGETPDERITPLHSVADADRVRRHLTSGARVVILGGGLIGAEAASAAVEAGAHVTLVNRSEPAGARIYGAEAARELEEEHRSHGVRLISSFSVGERPGPDGVEVTLETGESLVADLVIDAGGAVPADALAEQAGVEVWGDAVGGVRVDAAGRTSHPRVLAIGDVARRGSRWTGHWEAALHSAEDAAAGLLGQAGEERGVPWFWSDRYGRHLEVLGDPNAGDVLVERRDERGVKAVFACVPADHAGGERDVVVLGAVTFDDARLSRAARRLADRGKPVDPAALADPEVAARSLLR